MSDQVSLAGNLQIGNLGVCEGAFPGALTTIPVFIGGGGCAGTKPAPAKFSGVQSYNSPGAFVALAGVGTGQPVTQGNFIYLKSDQAMQVRITQQNTPFDDVSIINVRGIFVLEFPDDHYLKLLEVKGVGKVEYVVSGNQ